MAITGDVYDSRADEQAWLGQFFWVAAAQLSGRDRLDLLKRMACVRVPEPPGWNYEEVRAAYRRKADRRKREPRRGIATPCFVCLNRDRPRYGHHVIQLQHHGSNHPLNIVPLCYVCHREIHPHLPIQEPSGWTQVAVLVETFSSGVDAAGSLDGGFTALDLIEVDES